MALNPYKRARLEHEWTQVQLSKISGVPQPVISMVERGMIARPEYMRRLEKVLGLRTNRPEEREALGGN